MTSERVQTEFGWRRLSTSKIEENGFEESAHFGVYGSPTKFYLRLTKQAELSLHLASCLQEKLNIVKLDVEVGKYGSTKKIRYSLNEFQSGEVTLDRYTQLCLGFFNSSNLNDWYINCTITYDEPRPNVPEKVNYKLNLTDQLSALRLDSDKSDVTLVTVVDGKEHSAHKFILSLRSPVFEAMFSHEGLVENVENRVKIEDVTGEAMEAFLDYIYGGDVAKAGQFAGELFELANKYDIPLLAQACIEAITVDNAAQLYYLADLHNQEELKKKTMLFIGKYKIPIKQTKGWSEFIEPNAKLLNQLVDYL